MAQIPTYLPQPADYKLEVYFTTECLRADTSYETPNLVAMIERAHEFMSCFSDVDVKCKRSNY